MIRLFARHPTAANLLMLVLIALGIIGAGRLQRETFPDFAANELEIRVPYPGASAEEVEEGINQRIEDALDGVRFVKEVRSDAREGIGIVTVEMEKIGKFMTFKDDVRTEIDAINDFPTEAEDPIITELGITDPVVSILVTGPMRPPDLKAYCEKLKDRLQVVPGITLVKIRGFSDHQFRIELSREALMRHGLSASEVADTVARQSLNLPAGSIETRERDILLRFVEERRSIRELEEIIVVANSGAGELRLGDIGKVVDTFETAEDKIQLGQRRAGLIVVEKNKNQDVIRIADTVKAFVARDRLENPKVEYQLINDFSILVKDRLNMLLKNGCQGLVLVFLTMWLFFNVRLSFWVVASLPISFLGAFYLLPMMGMTINMLTMVALLIALGLLMDDGIVIAENVATHLGKGKGHFAAAIDGVNEVKWGVVSSFITTICVLGTLISLEGDIGKVLRVVPIVLIMVLAVSLIEAFLILPAHLAHSLHGHEKDQGGWFRQRIDHGFEYLREHIFGRAIDRLLERRYLFLGCVVGVFLLTIGLVAGGIVKFRAFPEIDGDQITAKILMPPGTPLARTEAVVGQMTEALERVNARFKPGQPEQQDLVKVVFTEFNKNMDAFEAGPHVATVNADLLSAEIRDALLDDVIQAWREEVGNLPDVLSLVIGTPVFGPAGRAIEVRLQGHDLGEMKEASGKLAAWFARYEGVFDLADDLRQGKQEFRLRLQDGVLGRGMDAQMIAGQLRAAYQGSVADEIQVGPESYEISVQLPANDQDSLADFEAFHVTMKDGTQAPLGAVAKWTTGYGWSRIARVDGLRTVTVRGDTDPRIINTSELFSALKKDFLPQLKEQHPDIQVSFQGEVAEGGKTQASMKSSMMLGMLGVFILLSFQFRSYTEPFIVMVAIPLSIIGAVGGHLVMGADLSMPSMLGIVSLAGIVVNDSILLVLFLKQRRAEGRPILEAAGQASRQRFRAILLTSVTTIAGLLPLLSEKSMQAQILIPLAISIAFGLMASTVLVLLVIPCLYSVMGDLGLVTKPEEDEE